MNREAIRYVALHIMVLSLYGCATMTDDWRFMQRDNSRKSYEEFVRKYPVSDLAREAKRRIDDADYAFVRTCQIGTKEAFEGFIASHPTSDYVAIAKSAVERLSLDSYDSFKNFVLNHPENPFVADAIALVPILWLRETGAKVGVEINVGKPVFRGILGGMLGKGTTRAEIWEKTRKELEKEGVQSMLLENTQSDNLHKDVQYKIRIDYSERVADRSRPYPGSATAAYHQSSVDNLASIFIQDVRADTAYSVRSIDKDIAYFDGFTSLFSFGGQVNRKEVLRVLGREKKDLAAFMGEIRMEKKAPLLADYDHAEWLIKELRELVRQK